MRCLEAFYRVLRWSQGGILITLSGNTFNPTQGGSAKWGSTYTACELARYKDLSPFHALPTPWGTALG